MSCFPTRTRSGIFAPKLATRFNQVLVSDVIDFRATDGSVVMVRQLFQGKLNADVKFGGEGPYFASIQAGAFRAENAGWRQNLP